MSYAFPRRVSSLVLLVLIAVCGAMPAYGNITADAWSLTTHAELEAIIPDEANANTPVLPFTLTHTAMVDVGVGQRSEGTSSYDFSTDGNAGLFQFSFDHLAAGVSSDVSSSMTGSNGFLLFTPDTDITYALSGDYAQTGIGLIHLDLSLAEVGVVGELFATVQEAADVTNQAFTFSSGSGMLNAGTQYRLLYDFYIEGGDPSSLSATGGISFQLGVQVVPAPGAVALAVVGLGFVALVRRRFA